ncbi:MAG: preprotein translocase subunit YajC [Pseudonocardia sp.]|nr:preprotein translocase subunit YajC [Pseudonocardia sp.]
MENLTSLLFPLLILLLFIPIFLSSRRQKKQLAQTQTLQASLEVGDVVVTTSGIRATVVDASYEETIDLEIADGVVTTWVRAAIREKVPVVDDTEPSGAVAGSVTEDVAPPTADASADGVASERAVPSNQAVSLEKGDAANGAPRS